MAWQHNPLLSGSVGFYGFWYLRLYKVPYGCSHKGLNLECHSAQIMMIDVAYEVVQEVITDSGAAQLVSSAWASIPGDIQSTLSFFKIPQGLSLLFSAIPTRWAMRFIPGA
ncbi:DUF2523 family protein [Pseudomonas huanghezhanensis]|uniref:DUF2523 family protein n=1 Tax=Pseudomonas huanghezhanensis TaxID=3002903 RepID=UPI0022860C80|nr:DUF2523 family protein [Pseudomonas sp. BSw22131]